MLKRQSWQGAGRSVESTYSYVSRGASLEGVVPEADKLSAASESVRGREAETRFRNMANGSPALLWMAGPDSLCTFFNQTWLDFTGRTLDQEWGVGWAEGVHFEDFQKSMETYQRAFAARDPFEMEYRLRRRDGQYRWMLDRGTPRFGVNGEFLGYVGLCVDITEQKQLEHALRKSVRDRDDFLSVASQELRAPLTALLLYVQSLKRALESERDAEGSRRKALSNAVKAERHTKHIVWMVDEILYASGSVRSDHPHAGGSARSSYLVTAPRTMVEGAAKAGDVDGSFTRARPKDSVLVVDDDHDIRHALAEILAEEGYSVAMAKNGKEALLWLRDPAREQLPSVILLDLMMPVMDGVEFRREQSHDPVLRGIPVVVLTADGSAPQKAARLGVAEGLRKPVDLEAVLSAVERHRL